MKSFYQLVDEASDDAQKRKEYYMEAWWYTWRDSKHRYHRTGGPALERIPDKKTDRPSWFWYQYGALHRIGGPAALYMNGCECWYQDDKLHRVDGPAVEHNTVHGEETGYYIHGKPYSKEAFEKLFDGVAVEDRETLVAARDI